jgi:tetratricopeptide (TPR) repeat protein
MRAQALIGLRRFEEALVALDLKLRIHPNNVIGLGMRAQALIGLRRFTEALVILDSLLKINPNNVIGLGMRAQALIGLGRFKEAEVVVSSLEEGVHKYFFRSQILVLTGRAQEAIVILENLKLNSTVQWKLAHAHYVLGNMLEAKKHLVRLIQSSQVVDLHAIAALIKIAENGQVENGQEKVTNSFIQLLLSRIDPADVFDLLRIKDAVFWSYTPQSIDIGPSIYNSFWSGLYSQPVDGQTYHSTN